MGLKTALLAPLFATLLFQQQPAAPAGLGSYIVGARDVLAITVMGEPDLSRRYPVDADGTFEFPWIGRITAAGKSPREIEEALTKALANGYLKRPNLMVDVEQYRSQSIFVMGEVRAPGRYPLGGTLGVLEALALAGSTVPTASGELLIVRPKSGSGSATPATPGQEAADVTYVNVKDLQTGKVAVTLQLRDGDTIFVPRAETFYISGHVRSPGAFTLQQNLTVLQALALAGGVTDRGSTGRLKVIRFVGGQKKEVSIKLSDVVLAGDTVVVGQRLF